MRAMIVPRYGSADVLELADLPDPVPGPRDLLIEVHATSMNPVDAKIRDHGMRQDAKFPLVLGFDVSGVVVDVGDEVFGFREGDEVYASPSLVRPGANAELVLVDCRSAALKPRTLSHEKAATLPLVTITAVEALYERARLRPGELVLIHAGAGGVGHIAIQLAMLRECRVLATASRPESMSLLRELAVDEIIDYSSQDFVERVMDETDDEGCPVVLDAVGGDTFQRSLECVSVDGRLVTILGTAPQQTGDFFLRNATLHYVFMGAPAVFDQDPSGQGAILAEAATLVDEGKLYPHVSEVIDLEDIADGHRLIEDGHTTGKISVVVR